MSATCARRARIRPETTSLASLGDAPTWSAHSLAKSGSVRSNCHPCSAAHDRRARRVARVGFANHSSAGSSGVSAGASAAASSGESAEDSVVAPVLLTGMLREGESVSERSSPLLRVTADALS